MPHSLCTRVRVTPTTPVATPTLDLNNDLCNNTTCVTTMTCITTTTLDHSNYSGCYDNLDYIDNFMWQQCLRLQQQVNLIKLMISHDLPRSTVTNQIAFNQQYSSSIPDFERAMDRRCQALVSNLETLHTINFT